MVFPSKLKLCKGLFPRSVITSVINPLRARNALRQHFRVNLYTLESAS